MIPRILLALAALALPFSAVSAKAPPIPAKAGLVSAADPRAAAAGVTILRQGGSAADATIAMMLALNVVEPQSSGIGGGGFMVHHDAKTGKTASFDGREKAPAAADGHWFYANGQPLPHFNGFPARLVVPGWTGTYWMKHLIHVEARTTPQGGFWMKPAYRVPVGLFPLRDRFVTQEDATSTPITEMVVNSLITSHRDGAKVKAGKVTVAGLAWDGGYGIGKVEVSTDGGKTWSSAKLGEDLGKFAFRPWSFDVQVKGKATVMVNATNAIGQTQVTKLLFNGAGYHNNVMQSITLTA